MAQYQFGTVQIVTAVLAVLLGQLIVLFYKGWSYVPFAVIVFVLFSAAIVIVWRVVNRSHRKGGADDIR